MRVRGIRAKVSVAAGLALFAALVLVPEIASASGGGGCGRAVTDASVTRVEIRDFCFGPTIIRVAPGDVVTFTNRDPVPHSVLGANGSWGSYEALKRRSELTFRFTQAGVYPYVCTYHIGMVGAVVVGDGVGGAIGTTTAAGPVVPVDATELDLQNAAVVTAPVGSPASRTSWIMIAGMLGLVIGAGVAFAVRRRRRGSPA